MAPSAFSCSLAHTHALHTNPPPRDTHAHTHTRPSPQAPLVPHGTPVVNALSKQRAMLENIFRACVGLPPDNNMMLEFK